MTSTINSVSEISTHKNSENFIHARYQILSLAVFGALAMVASLIFSVWSPVDTNSKWFWIVLGPTAGLILMFNAQKKLTSHAANNPGPYMGIFIGSISGCFIISYIVNKSWMVPASLLIVAVLLAFLAWFERNGLGMTSAIVVGTLTGLTAASNLTTDSALITASLGLVLVTGAAATKINADSQPQIHAQRDNRTTTTSDINLNESDDSDVESDNEEIQLAKKA